MNSTSTTPVVPALDSGFIPMIRMLENYEKRVRNSDNVERIQFAATRPEGTVFTESFQVLPPSESSDATIQYLERQLKMLLWQKGGNKVYVTGNKYWSDILDSIYSPKGTRAFDADFIGQKLFQQPFQVIFVSESDLPQASEPSLQVGGYLQGCRIGFDLGGSDRKCAAVIDGEVVYSTEIGWDPYFQSDPQYHRQGIEDSLKRAAAHLPRVDAIGGSAAGVYIENEVRAGSLYRGLSSKDFDRYIRGYFRELEQQWGVPVVIANDGEVTALAASLSKDSHQGILGVSLGTSTAAGYVNSQGRLTSWLNELAFTPVDSRVDGPRDEWSGDIGCGVQYFSQQAVARLGPLAGIPLNEGEKFPEFLLRVQEAMDKNQPAAQKIYQTLGCYLGYSIPYWHRRYEFSDLLLLGRVMSGPGGELIQKTAGGILQQEYPQIADNFSFLQVNERDKRHGQAIAAASLPSL
jgi:predicted NBD/HSP70 family sugar kinase